MSFGNLGKCKKGTKKTTTKSQTEFDTELKEARINQSLVLKSRIRRDPASKKPKRKETHLVVIIVTQKGRKQAGIVPVDLGNYSFEGEGRISQVTV